MTGMEELMFKMMRVTRPRLTTMDRIRIGSKLVLVSVLASVLAPVTYPLVSIENAKYLRQSRLWWFLAGILTIPVAPLGIVLSPIVFILPWLPSFEVALASFRRSPATSTVHRAMAWAYK